MNIEQFNKIARPIVTRSRKLNEDSGSEGFLYKISAAKGLKSIQTEEFKIDEISSENGNQTGQLTFEYPHDCGFAETVLIESMPELQLIALELIY